jgi:hypothetical protein
MSILSITTDFSGQVGVSPRLPRITCDDDLATVTSLNYLQGVMNQGYPFYPTDMVAITYSGGFGFFQPEFSSSGITLVASPDAGGVILPVVVNNVATFADTSGTLHDVGLAKATIATWNGSPVSGNVVEFSNTTGRVTDSGIVATNVQLQNNIIARDIGDAGGSATVNLTLTGVTTSSIALVNFKTKTNASNILSVVPSANSLAVVCSADPGVAQYACIVFVAPQ